MNVVVVFFSQTGNTKKVTDAIVDTFRSKGHSAKTISLMDADPRILHSADLLGFGTPCFSSQAPQPVMHFIKSLPSMTNKMTFIFATCGGAPGRVLLDMRNGLRKKGANVIGGFLTRGEVSHPAPALIGRFRDRPNADDLDQARCFARDVCAQISERGSAISADMDSIKRWGFYELLGTALFDAYLRLFMPEPKINPTDCNLCEICAQECPTQNINLEPYPVLGSDCIRCYHCHKICPREAFSVNWHLSNPILCLLYNQAFVRWFGDLQPGERIY